MDIYTLTYPSSLLYPLSSFSHTTSYCFTEFEISLSPLSLSHSRYRGGNLSLSLSLSISREFSLSSKSLHGDGGDTAPNTRGRLPCDGINGGDGKLLATSMTPGNRRKKAREGSLTANQRREKCSGTVVLKQWRYSREP